MDKKPSLKQQQELAVLVVGRIRGLGHSTLEIFLTVCDEAAAGNCIAFAGSNGELLLRECEDWGLVKKAPGGKWRLDRAFAAACVKQAA